VHITQNFQRPLAAKLCFGDEHVLAMQERYGPPIYHRVKFGGAQISRAARGRKSSMFCFLFLSGFLFVRHFAMKELEYGSDLGIV